MSERNDPDRSDGESAFGGNLPASGADAFGSSPTSGFTPPSPPPSDAVPPPPPPPPDAFASPGYGGYGASPSFGGTAGPAPGYGTQPASGTSGKAIWALVLSLLAFVLCPVVASIGAIALGASAKQDIDRSPGLGGRGLAQAGFVLGIAGLAIYAVGIVIVLIADNGS
jgi:hypothetical protein